MSELLDIATRVAGWANDGEQVEAFVVHETETEVRAYEGEVESLRSFKDDVKEVGEGHECGIVIANFSGVEAEDVIEAYELEKLRPTL